MSVPSRDEPSVHREGGRRGNDERQHQAAPEQRAAEPGIHRPGMMSIIALSTISMIVIDTVSEARASLRTTPVASPEASSGR